MPGLLCRHVFQTHSSIQINIKKIKEAENKNKKRVKFKVQKCGEYIWKIEGTSEKSHKDTQHKHNNQTPQKNLNI